MSKAIEFTGLVKAVSEVTSGTTKDGKQWQKQTIVVEEDATERPSGFVIECFNKPDEVAKCQPGATVKVFVNHSVNLWNDKHYQKIDLWKCELVNAENTKNDLAF